MMITSTFRLILGLTILSSCTGVSGQASKGPERFTMPPLSRGDDNRIFPHPAWVTTRWDPRADAPFQAAQDETKPYRDRFVIDKSGKWPAKARKAYEEWRMDCQNPVKLHRACVFFDISGAVDQSFGVSKEDKRRREELTIGWDILRNPPKSYIFVRRGYGWNAGDHHRHIFGDLAKALLKRDPLDRYVAHGALGELLDESRKKDAELEQFLIDTFERIRKTSAWTFLDYTGLAALYEHRAFRTTRRSDMVKAIEFGELAFKGAPKGYDAKWLEDARDSLVRRMKYMKID